MPSALRRLLVLVPLASSACDRGSEGSDEAADSVADTGTGSETSEATGCAAEVRDDEFAIGLSKSSSLIGATFVSADPAPPIKGDNTWMIVFADPQGQPLSDLTIVVTPRMPDHGHGTPISAVVSATDVPGEYAITPVNLFMAGYWEITFDVTLAGGEQDSIMFGFCVE